MPQKKRGRSIGATNKNKQKSNSKPKVNKMNKKTVEEIK
jgi:hypothetical protein